MRGGSQILKYKPNKPLFANCYEAFLSVSRWLDGEEFKVRGLLGVDNIEVSTRNSISNLSINKFFKDEGMLHIMKYTTKILNLYFSVYSKSEIFCSVKVSELFDGKSFSSDDDIKRIELMLKDFLMCTSGRNNGLFGGFGLCIMSSVGDDSDDEDSSQEDNDINNSKTFIDNDGWVDFNEIDAMRRRITFDSEDNMICKDMTGKFNEIKKIVEARGKEQSGGRGDDRPRRHK